MEGERNGGSGPDRIVDAEGAYEAFAEGVTVLDMRRPNEYEAGHVEGEIHVLRSLELDIDTDRSACPCQLGPL